MAQEDASFGYRKVHASEKSGLVADVFRSVAWRYDLMNDLMSLGIHRAWKSAAAALCCVRPGNRVLDLAGGSGDMAVRIMPRLGGGEMVLADVNEAMLDLGRRRLLDAGYARVRCVRCDAEALPFDEDNFDRIVMAFGLRNVTHKHLALEAAHRVLKPGGRFVILEFSSPHAWLRPAYDKYSFHVIPRLGKYVAGDEGSYRYLVESIRVHPGQQEMRGMMETAGFERCEYFNLSGGIVAVHRGCKL